VGQMLTNGGSRPQRNIVGWKPGQILTVQQDEDLQKLISDSDGKWLVVEFCAEWSAASMSMRQTMHCLALKYTNTVFARADIDQLPHAAASHTVIRIPVYMFFFGGVKETECAGASERKLHETLLNCLELGPCAPIPGDEAK